MPKIDIVIEINFNLNEPEKTVIKTNAKKEAVTGILEEWLCRQIGQGKDDREPNKKNEYKVMIKLDLNDDMFFTGSDTGNESLTCGIVIDAYSRLDELTIVSLS